MEACPDPEQAVVIQEAVTAVRMPPLPIVIARRTKVVRAWISSIVNIVKAINASEIPSQLVISTASTQHNPGFQDVVKREDFREIQGPISIAVQPLEKIEADPIASVLK